MSFLVWVFGAVVLWCALRIHRKFKGKLWLLLVAPALSHADVSWTLTNASEADTYEFEIYNDAAATLAGPSEGAIYPGASKSGTITTAQIGTAGGTVLHVRLINTTTWEQTELGPFGDGDTIDETFGGSGGGGPVAGEWSAEQIAQVVEDVRLCAIMVCFFVGVFIADMLLKRIRFYVVLGAGCLLGVEARAATIYNFQSCTFQFNVTASGIPPGTYTLLGELTATPHFNGTTSSAVSRSFTVLAGGIATMDSWPGHQTPFSPDTGSWEIVWTGVLGQPDWSASGSLGLSWNKTVGGTGTVTETVSVIVTGDCPPRGAVNFEFDLDIAPGAPLSVVLPKVHEIQLFVNGSLRKTFTMPIPPGQAAGNVIVKIKETVASLPGSFSYEWKVDGESVGTGSVDCGDEIENNTVTDNGVWEQKPGSGGGGTPPDETSSTSTDGKGNTTTTTNTGSGTSGTGVGTGSSRPPGQTQTQTSTVNNGSETMDNATVQDFYNAMRQAFLDANNSGTIPSGGPNGAGPGAGGADGRGTGGTDGEGNPKPGAGFEGIEPNYDLDSLKAESDGLRDALAAVRSGGASIVGGNQLAGLPTDLPQGGSFTFVEIGGYSGSVNLDSSGFSGVASIVRQAILWVATLGFVIACVNTVREYIA